LALSFWLVTAVVGLFLNVAVIAAMQRTRRFSDYPLVLAYSVILLLTTTVEITLLFGLASVPADRKTYAVYYWSNEVILQTVIFGLMLSLIHRASRCFARGWLWCVIPTAVVVGVVTYSVYSVGAQPGITRHMTVVSRDLNFCTALLNVVLWSALLRNKRRSVELLMVSGGIGLYTTGKAIGHSVRSMSAAATTPGNVIVVVGHLLCLFIWWRTFRRPSARAANAVSQAA
jgi:hypothetical protein